MENKPIPFKGRSLAFTAALVFTFIIATFSINIDFTEFIQREKNNIPIWYFCIVFFIDFAILASLVLIYFYRKIGVYAFPIMVFAHFITHLPNFFYFDLFLLFLYFCLILVAVVPRWPFYK